jgi:Holliday junction resolvase RusA-like endonuclease
VDNINKVIADALNKLAYEDDKQVIKATVTKYYTAGSPRITIEILQAGFLRTIDTKGDCIDAKV